MSRQLVALALSIAIPATAQAAVLRVPAGAMKVRVAPGVTGAGASTLQGVSGVSLNGSLNAISLPNLTHTAPLVLPQAAAIGQVQSAEIIGNPSSAEGQSAVAASARVHSASNKEVSERQAIPGAAATKAAAHVGALSKNKALKSVVSGRSGYQGLNKLYHDGEDGGSDLTPADGDFGGLTPAESGLGPAVGSDAWLQARIMHSPRGLNILRFRAGEYKPEYDARAKALGVDVVLLRRPSRDEIETYKEEDGYHLKSRWVRWVMKTTSVDEYLNTEGRGKLRKAVRKSEGVPYEVMRLDDPAAEAAFKKWHPLYMSEIVGKPGGRMHVGPDYLEKMSADERKQWHFVVYPDPADPEKVLGGMLIKERPEFGILSLGFAAYTVEAKRKFAISYRSVIAGLELAQRLGFPILSAGADTNFYGYDYDLGLLGWKASVYMTPYPEEPFELARVLNSEKFSEATDHQGKRGGMFFHGVRREGPFYDRLLDQADSQPGQDTEEGFHLQLLDGPYFGEGVPTSRDVILGRHLYVDDVKTKLPDIEVVRQPAP
jgi:hypothetical protein